MLEDLIFPPETPDLPPLRLGTVHIKKLVVSVPWGRWTTGFLDVQLDDPRRGNLSEEPAQWETARLHANFAGVVRSALLHQEPKEFAGLLDQ